LTYEHDSEFIVENNELGFYEDGMCHVQGLINLADNHEADGSFVIVPGFGKKRFEEWTKSTHTTLGKRFPKQETFIVMPDDSPLLEHAQRVTAHAGSLIIWDQRTLHGSVPNNSKNNRYAQFIKMSPAIDQDTKRCQNRKAAISRKLAREGFEPSGLGKKLFTLEPWL
jgi:ectoine hydroxylase-related dioxygenase (phytanoyl-CoA dioxygenase family)